MRLTGSPVFMCLLRLPQMSRRLDQRFSIMEALLVLSQLVMFILCSENLLYKAESFLSGVGGRVRGSQNLLWALIWDGANPGKQHCVCAAVFLQHPCQGMGCVAQPHFHWVGSRHLPIIFISKKKKKKKKRFNWASLPWLFYSLMSFLHLGDPIIS